MNEPPAALAPYRALDLTGALGALAGRVLAGLGADVIKVERPGGDPARARGPFFKNEPHPERSFSWIFANAGKRGITLEPAAEQGRELLLRLTAVCDFLIESLPPGRLAALGLTDEQLLAANPALVIVHISPFGQSGPYRDLQATDLIAWALGGQLYLDGDDDRAPTRPTAPQSELLAGVHAAAGAMTAHYLRTRTGRGQSVDIAAQECVTWTLMIAAQVWDISHINSRRGGAVRAAQRADGSTLVHRVLWPCKDGFVLWGLSGGQQAGTLVSTQALVRWMAEEGVTDAPIDTDWSKLSAAMMDQETYDRLSAPFLTFFAGKTKRELFEGSLARSIQLAAVNEIPDVAASPQLEDRQYWCDVAHEYLGATLRFPGAPVRLSRTPWRAPRPAPLPGEHNREVFGDLIGLGAEELRRLCAAGVI
ncbi:MAG TPA: CoA transferase [Dehalococcoidia bacterium]|jgi:benzylsuccinate CoA-transferase BbsE subunit/naphthyl-2-methylsuccinate CoA transferase subunit